MELFFNMNEKFIQPLNIGCRRRRFPKRRLLSHRTADNRLKLFSIERHTFIFCPQIPLHTVSVFTSIDAAVTIIGCVESIKRKKDRKKNCLLHTPSIKRIRLRKSWNILCRYNPGYGDGQEDGDNNDNGDHFEHREAPLPPLIFHLSRHFDRHGSRHLSIFQANDIIYICNILHFL